MKKNNKVLLAAAASAALMVAPAVLGGNSVSAATGDKTTDAQIQLNAAVSETHAGYNVGAKGFKPTETAMKDANFAAGYKQGKADYDAKQAEAEKAAEAAKNNKVQLNAAVSETHAGYNVGAKGFKPTETAMKDANFAAGYKQGKADFDAKQQKGFTNEDTPNKSTAASNKAAKTALGDAIVDLENLAALKNLPNENVVNEILADAINIYKNGTAAQVAQRAKDVSEVLAEAKELSAKQDEKAIDVAVKKVAIANAAKKAAQVGADRKANEDKLGDAVTDLENLAALKNLPNESEVNEVIAEGIQAYQDAKAGKTSNEDLATQATVASELLKQLKAESAKQDEKAIDAFTKKVAIDNFVKKAVDLYQKQNAAKNGFSNENTPNLSTRASDVARAEALGFNNENTPNLSTRASDEARKNALVDQEGPEVTPTATTTGDEGETAGDQGQKKTVKAAVKAAAKASYPQTGNEVNGGAMALGVVAAIGALFGLAGTSLKKQI